MKWKLNVLYEDHVRPSVARYQPLNHRSIFPDIRYSNTSKCRPHVPRSKGWVCGRSVAGIAGSNPAVYMKVCLLWVLCVVRYRSLRRADHSSRGVRLWCVWVWSWILDNEEALAHWGLLCRGKKKFVTKICPAVVSFVKIGSVLVVWWRQWIPLCAVSVCWQLRACENGYCRCQRNAVLLLSVSWKYLQ